MLCPKPAAPDLSSGQGFTLLELLIAMSRLAGALAVILPSVRHCLRQQDLAQRRAVSLMVAQSLLAEQSAHPCQGAESGSNTGRRWTVHTRPLPEPAQGLQAVWQTLLIEDPEDPLPLHFQTVLLCPTPPAMGGR